MLVERKKARNSDDAEIDDFVRCGSAGEKVQRRRDEMSVREGAQRHITVLVA